MTNTMRDFIKSRGRADRNWTRYSVKGQLEKLDREADHDYVPMDVFIDPRTMKEHFQESSIRARLTGTYSAAA